MTDLMQTMTKEKTTIQMGMMDLGNVRKMVRRSDTFGDQDFSWGILTLR